MHPRPAPVPISETARQMLALTCAPGLGPVLIARAIGALGSVKAVLEAPPERLRTIEGFGPGRSRALGFDHAGALARANEQITRAQDLGIQILAIGEPGYPPLLNQIPDPPPVIYLRGALDPQRDRYPVAIVGSRACTAYGLEQAERFASGLAGAGLTVVSGGARGVDTGAHRAAARAGGRTIVVLGCGLANVYPPENKDLFDKLVAHDRGVILSELPLDAPPEAKNFPSRNRIISGLSLGVVVIEAGKGSGSLITARQAAEEHGREVFAVPGRVDSPASEGTHELLKSGGAHLVTSPADVIAMLEQPAWHQHRGSHADRYATAAALELHADEPVDHQVDDADVPTPESSPAPMGLTAAQSAILAALDTPRSADELVRLTGLEPGQLRGELTMLEIRRTITRQGTRWQRVSATRS